MCIDKYNINRKLPFNKSHDNIKIYQKNCNKFLIHFTYRIINFDFCLQLFDHIADCISKFMIEHNMRGLKLHLGFTFSFPCKQEGLAVGRLVTWTKGFKCSGVEGQDVVRLLHEAIRRKKVHSFVFCLFVC